MRFKKLTLILSNFIIGTVLIIGAIMGVVMLHEYSHLVDYKQLNKTSDELCFLVYPNKIQESGVGAYYSFRYNSTEQNINLDKKISRYTEIKAYSLMFLALVLIFLSYFIVLNDWGKYGR